MRATHELTSRRHAIVQRCRALATGADRDGEVLLDGEHLIEEALRAGVALRAVISTSPGSALARRAAAAGAEVYRATASVIEAASPVRSPGGLVAIAVWAPASLDDVLAATTGAIIGLVDVQDPGNVGAIIRSADALGGGGVVTIGQTADPGSWKSLRGAMGSTFRVPVARASLTETLEAAARRGLTVAATTSAGGDPIDRTSLAPPLLVLVGNEGAGLPRAVLDRASAHWHVPMAPGANSLNVGVTAALVLYEAARQRAGRRVT